MSRTTPLLVKQTRGASAACWVMLCLTFLNYILPCTLNSVERCESILKRKLKTILKCNGNWYLKTSVLSHYWPNYLKALVLDSPFLSFKSCFVLVLLFFLYSLLLFFLFLCVFVLSFCFLFTQFKWRGHLKKEKKPTVEIYWAVKAIERSFFRFDVEFYKPSSILHGNSILMINL